jgi:hypothetical protein
MTYELGEPTDDVAERRKELRALIALAVGLSGKLMTDVPEALRRALDGADSAPWSSRFASDGNSIE